METGLELFQRVYGNQPLSAIPQTGKLIPKNRKKLKTAFYVGIAVFTIVGIYATITSINDKTKSKDKDNE